MLTTAVEQGFSQGEICSFTHFSVDSSRKSGVCVNILESRHYANENE